MTVERDTALQARDSAIKLAETAVGKAAAEMDRMQAEIGQLQGSLEEVSRDRDAAWRSRDKAIETSAATDAATVKAHQALVDGLQKQLADSHQQCTDLLARYDRLRQTSEEDLKRIRSQCDDEMDEVERASKARIAAAEADAAARIGAAEARLAAAEAVAAEARSAESAAKSHLAAAQASNSSSSDNASELEATVANLRIQLNKALTIGEERNTAMRVLQSKLEHALTERDAAAFRADEHSAASAAADARLSSLRSNLAAVTASRDSMQTRIADLELQFETATAAAALALQQRPSGSSGSDDADTAALASSASSEPASGSEQSAHAASQSQVDAASALALDMARASIADQGNTIATMSSSISSLTAQLGVASNDAEVAKLESSSLSHDLELCRAELQAEHAQYVVAASQLAGLTRELEEAVARCDTLQAQLAVAGSVTASSEGENINAATAAAATAEVASLRGQLDETAALLEQERAAHQASRGEVARLQQANSVLREEADDASAEIVRLEAQLRDSESVYASKDAELRSAMAQLQQANAEVVAELQQKCDAAQLELSACMLELEAARRAAAAAADDESAAVASLRAEVEQHKREAHECSQAIMALEDELTSATDVVHARDASIHVLQQRLHDTRHKSTVLAAMNMKLQRWLEGQEASLIAAETANDGLRTLLHAGEQQLVAANDRLQELGSDVDGKAATISDLSLRVHELQQIVDHQAQQQEEAKGRADSIASGGAAYQLLWSQYTGLLQAHGALLAAVSDTSVREDVMMTIGPRSPGNAHTGNSRESRAMLADAISAAVAAGSAPSSASATTSPSVAGAVHLTHPAGGTAASTSNGVSAKGIHANDGELDTDAADASEWDAALRDAAGGDAGVDTDDDASRQPTPSPGAATARDNGEDADDGGVGMAAAADLPSGATGVGDLYVHSRPMGGSGGDGSDIASSALPARSLSASAVKAGRRPAQISISTVLPAVITQSQHVAVLDTVLARMRMAPIQPREVAPTMMKAPRNSNVNRPASAMGAKNSKI